MRRQKFMMIFLTIALLLTPRAALSYVEGEVLITLYMPHTHDNYEQYCDKMLAEAESMARDVAGKAGGEVISMYPYLSYKGDLVFAHCRAIRCSTEQLIERLKSDERVVGACPNYIVQSQSTTNDPDWWRLWGMRKIHVGESPQEQDAWEISTGSPNILVAVMDTGIDWTHDDITPNYRDAGGVFTSKAKSILDVDGHGTHVAGIIGAVGNNAVGTVGINWLVGMMSLKILEKDGQGDVNSIIAAIEYLVHYNDNVGRVYAVNMSFSFEVGNAPGEMMTSPVYNAFKHLDEQNMTVMVAAAGNGAINLGCPTTDSPYRYPACLPIYNLISVGAVNRDGHLLGTGADAAKGSNWSATMVDVLAPGEDIWSTAVHNSYENRTGTSMAAPHVTGTIALMASVNPDLSANDYKKILLTAADDSINPPGIVGGETVEDSSSSVWGLLNARRALENTLEAQPDGDNR